MRSNEKQREAVLKHTGGDMSKSTNFMDADTEYKLLDLFQDWGLANASVAQNMDDSERVSFYDGLLTEVSTDRYDVHDEYNKFGFYVLRQDDGTYGVVSDLHTGNNNSNTSRSSGHITEDEVSKANIHTSATLRFHWRIGNHTSSFSSSLWHRSACARKFRHHLPFCYDLQVILTIYMRAPATARAIHQHHVATT